MIKSKYLGNHKVKIYTGSRDLDSAILERKSIPNAKYQCQKWDDIVISAGFSCFHLTINLAFSFHTSAHRLCPGGICSVSKEGINCRP